MKFKSFSQIIDLHCRSEMSFGNPSQIMKWHRHVMPGLMSLSRQNAISTFICFNVLKRSP